MAENKRMKNRAVSVFIAILLLAALVSFAGINLYAASNNTLDTPKLSSVSNTATGVKVSWDKVEGAEKYRLFYKTDGGSWKGIVNTASTSYTWTGAKSGTEYAFTVRCVADDGSFKSGYDPTGKSIKYIAAPKISNVVCAEKGVKISWGKVTGADKYRVFYKAADGSWKGIANTASTSYTWSGAKSNTEYTFTVRCMDENASLIGGYDSAGKSVKYIAAPKISSVVNAANGVSITWGKVAGAEKYRVFYKTADGSWKGIANTTATSYTWTGAKSGTKYTFTVRCLDKNGNYISSFDSAGKSVAYVAAPKISSVANIQSKVQINWDKVTGAVRYGVYCKTGSGTWTKIGDTTSNSYVWTGAKSGTTYAFTVRCLTANGTDYASGFDATGKSITTYCDAPKISSVTNEETGVQIVWGKVTGAVKYRVYYKTGSGTWTKIGDTTSNSYVWTGAKSGTAYTFTVRCLTADAKDYASGFDAVGKSIKYIAAPKLLAAINVATGTLISWEKTAGAAKYRLYYKTDSGEWTKIGDTASTDYTWTGAKSGTKYVFTVRCITSDGKSYTSSFSRAGKAVSSTFITSKGYKGEVKNGIVYIEGYLIANKTYPLPQSYGDGITSTAQAAFNKMKEGAKKDGITLTIASGYRSYSYQNTIYNNYCKRDGKKEADTYSARPGHSEHQSGLAMDLNTVGNSFNGTPQAKWLEKNCYKYGFILRYPKGKTNETGYVYESWHFRYVGEELAKKLYNGGDWLTMEDYFGFTSEYC